MSYKTAITRTKPSRPMRILFFEDKKLTNSLDFGCGKGFDADYYGQDKYDPHFFPNYPTKQYKLITCNYVLNTIPDTHGRDQVLREIRDLLTDDGVAYISVRRDLKHNSDTQFLVELPYEIHFQNNAVAIYKLTKKDN